MTILLAVAILALLALTTSVVVAGRAIVRSFDRPPPVPNWTDPTPEMDELRRQMGASNERHDSLKLAVSDGIERVHRAETRIAKTVTSARRLLAENSLEHAGLEAEYQEIQQRDAEPLEEAPLQLVPGVVEDHRPSGIPGVSRGDIDRIRSQNVS